MDKRALYIGINELHETVGELKQLLSDEDIHPDAKKEMNELIDITNNLKEAIRIKEDN